MDEEITAIPGITLERTMERAGVSGPPPAAPARPALREGEMQRIQQGRFTHGPPTARVTPPENNRCRFCGGNLRRYTFQDVGRDGKNVVTVHVTCITCGKHNNTEPGVDRNFHVSLVDTLQRRIKAAEEKGVALEREVLLLKGENAAMRDEGGASGRMKAENAALKKEVAELNELLKAAG